MSYNVCCIYGVANKAKGVQNKPKTRGKTPPRSNISKVSMHFPCECAAQFLIVLMHFFHFFGAVCVRYALFMPHVFPSFGMYVCLCLIFDRSFCAIPYIFARFMCRYLFGTACLSLAYYVRMCD